MSQPTNNPIAQQLQLLLGGYGFNFYADANKARADDLLVRQAASGHLTAAASSLAALEQAYRRRFIPPSTREHPYPPAAAMDALRDIAALKQSVGDLEARLRGMPIPTQDKIWWRFRDEAATLNALLSYDKLLIDQSELIAQTAATLTAVRWNDPASGAQTALDSPISALESTMRQRMQLLQVG